MDRKEAVKKAEWLVKLNRRLEKLELAKEYITTGTAYEVAVDLQNAGHHIYFDLTYAQVLQTIKSAIEDVEKEMDLIIGGRNA